MITISKQNDGVLFEFEDSKKYLFGDGSILVPFNSLTIIQDESDMITFRKAASNDIFLSARYDTDLGYTSKDDAVTALKELLFAEAGGGGVTSGEVQTMIDDSLEDYYDKDEVDAGFDSVNATLSGKADTSAVTAVANDVQTVSGQVQTKVATSDFNTYTAATATALNGKADSSDVYTKTEVDTAIGRKQDTLVSGTNIKTINNESILGSGNINIQGGVSNVIELTQAQYDALSSIDPDAIYVITDATAFDPSTKVDTSAITSSITSSSTNSEVAGAKAVYDAIQAGGGGVTVDPTLDTGSSNPVANSAITNAINAKQDALSAGTGIEISGNVISATGGGGATYSAGQGISIDTANTISFGVPIYSGATGSVFRPTYNNNSILIGNSNNLASVTSVAGGNACTGQNFSFVYGQTNTATGSTSVAIGNRLNATNDREAAFGSYNVSNKANTTFGDSGNTLFSVGNGTGAGTNANHNAFEIRQNGDIYVNDGTNDVRLQDTILALGGLKFVQCSQSDYDAMVSGGTVDSSTLYIVSNVVS